MLAYIAWKLGDLFKEVKSIRWMMNIDRNLNPRDGSELRSRNFEE
ncbi:hypothetical protein EM6_0075 [Asticcacaulis excentricus]|uniref:Uncharacterized protein n=1 Tax=Asticcacaulis excentricus TaxID=78587 RepID=A0A3G9G5M5_9CAUL|nr:hypothetical protein EM6_0075 [Asticcacaulis excentricus]